MILATLVVAILVAVTAAYVAAEFAAVASRRTKLAAMAESGHRSAAQILPHLEDASALDELVAACQVGITASSLVLGAYGNAAIASPIVSPWIAATFGVGTTGALAAAAVGVLLALTGIQVLFGELVPKAYALRYPERTMLALGALTLVSIRLLRPFIALFNGSSNLLLHLAGYEGSSRHAHLHAPEEIELLVTESGEAGALDEAERRMLTNALDLGELLARQVMTPRNRLVVGHVDAPPAALLARLSDHPSSSLLLFRDTPDEIVGVVTLRDLFHADVQGLSPTAVARPVAVVPENAPVSTLWDRMVHRGEPMVVVIDEYGGTAGAVGRRDLIEEVIGEVLDEHDARPDAIVERAYGPPLVRGDVSVEDVNDALGLALPTDRADTVGGLVLDVLGRMAEPGDMAHVEGVALGVLAVRDRSIVRVAVGAARPPEGPHDDQRETSG